MERYRKRWRDTEKVWNADMKESEKIDKRERDRQERNKHDRNRQHRKRLTKDTPTDSISNEPTFSLLMKSRKNGSK